MSWKEIVKMKNKYGETVRQSEKKYLFKILEEFLDEERDLVGSMGVAFQVAIRMDKYFDDNSEVVNQANKLKEAIDLAEQEAYKLQALLKNKYVGEGNLLEE
jgi:hypothetical protein|tara:strand:- start:57 stop:362 length:306 start_codon:yes stop_codon:yes gene_type:complete